MLQLCFQGCVCVCVCDGVSVAHVIIIYIMRAPDVGYCSVCKLVDVHARGVGDKFASPAFVLSQHNDNNKLHT